MRSLFGNDLWNKKYMRCLKKILKDYGGMVHVFSFESSGRIATNHFITFAILSFKNETIT